MPSHQTQLILEVSPTRGRGPTGETADAPLIRSRQDGLRHGLCSTVLFAEPILAGYARSVLRRVISAITLLGLTSAPVVGRTRLLCRYTGVEITDCAEQDVPGHPVLRSEGCCDRQMTRPLAATIGAGRYELELPLVCALPVPVVADTPAFAFAVVADGSPARAAGPPVFLITRALLI